MGNNLSADARNVSSIPGSGRSPREENVNPLQYSGLENPMDRGAWRAIVHGVAESRTRLSDSHTDAKIPIREEEVTYLMVTGPQTYWCPRAGNINPCDATLSPHPQSEAPCTRQPQTPERPSTTWPFKVMGLPWWLSRKEATCHKNARDSGFDP